VAELMTSERFHPRPAGRGTRLPRESWNLSACCFRFLPHLWGGGPGTLLEVESSTTSQTDGGRRTRWSNSFPTRGVTPPQALIKEGRMNVKRDALGPDDQSASGDEQWRSGRGNMPRWHLNLKGSLFLLFPTL